jgi:hypothetical protein
MGDFDPFFSVDWSDMEQPRRRQYLHIKIIDGKLMIFHVSGWIAETFDKDLFVIWSKNNSEKPIIYC